MSPIVEKAFKLGLRAHEGQTNKTDETPYIVHPVMVALLLAQHGFKDEVVAAALVHDVLEDTDVSTARLKEELGDKVLKLVQSLSEDKSQPWEVRKERYRETIRVSSDEVKAISVCDKIHNMRRLLSAHEKHGAAMWKFFNRGREQKLQFEQQMLEMFKETYPHPLVGEYERLLKEVMQLKD